MPYNKNEVKKCPVASYAYDLRSGSFSAEGLSYWVYCRDVWKQYKKKDLIFFKHGNGAGKKIAAFIDRIEKLKALKIDVKTEIGPTADPKVSWIQVSPWWQDDMRYSLFTALLRAGRSYTPDRFHHMLENAKYLKSTQRALKRFLRGHTEYKKGSRNFFGWVYNFSDTKTRFTDGKDAVNLVKPENQFN